jgi:hypothetical protein
MWQSRRAGGCSSNRPSPDLSPWPLRRNLRRSEGQVWRLPQPEQLHGRESPHEQGREWEYATRDASCRPRCRKAQSRRLHPRTVVPDLIYGTPVNKARSPQMTVKCRTAPPPVAAVRFRLAARVPSHRTRRSAGWRKRWRAGWTSRIRRRLRRYPRRPRPRSHDPSALRNLFPRCRASAPRP